MKNISLETEIKDILVYINEHGLPHVNSYPAKLYEMKNNYVKLEIEDNLIEIPDIDSYFDYETEFNTSINYIKFDGAKVQKIVDVNSSNVLYRN
ncbi:MAG: hypothetical protein ACMXX9_02935 [Candidatus Woesearchaeota archaeon]